MNQPNRPNKPDEWIEQYVCGTPNFGKRTSVTITRNGLGVDQIMLKFILPEFPKGLMCESFCVYDLIKNISLEIGGCTIFKFDAKQLYMLDQVERNFNNIQKCSTMMNNTILYPIDLKYFFKESKSKDDKNDNLMNDLPLDFKGIRLIDLDHHDVRFYVEITPIDNIINKAYFSGNDVQDYEDVMKKLQLVDCLILTHYVGIHYKNQITSKEIQPKDNNNIQNYSVSSWLPNYNIFKWLNYHSSPTPTPTPKVLNTAKLQKLKQSTCTWICDSWEINDKDHPISNLKYKIVTLTSNKNSSKIIFHSKMLNKIKFFNLQLDGFDYMERVNVEEYKKIYEYNNNITLDSDIFVFNAEITPTIKNAVLCMWFTEPCDNLRIDFMYDENGDSTIKGGMFAK